MPKYLLVESRDPFETDDVRHFYDLATALARAANRVTLYLTDNGVLAARAGQHTFWFAALARVGVEVLADGRSLYERGIAADRLSPGVTPTAVGTGVDRLAAGRTTLWHSSKPLVSQTRHSFFVPERTLLESSAMLTGLLGGALIGLAATVYLLATGRVAGVSGILAGALGDRAARGERLAFLAGLVGAGLLAAAVSSPAIANPTSTPVLLVAGVLVGFGTRVGGGCTSGHGVCGISRFSIASLVATATFVAVGAATVAIAGRFLLSGTTP